MLNAITVSVDYWQKFVSGLWAKLTLAVIILLIGFIIGKLAGRLMQKILHQFEVDVAFKKAAGIKVTIEGIIGSIITYFIYFIAVVMALNQFGLTTQVLYIVSISVIVFVIVALLLAIKDFVPNFFAGFFIFRKGIINVGDRIKLKNIEGKVIEVGLVETKVETKNKDHIFIPHSEMIKSELTVKKH